MCVEKETLSAIWDTYIDIQLYITTHLIVMSENMFAETATQCPTLTRPIMSLTKPSTSAPSSAPVLL